MEFVSILNCDERSKTMNVLARKKCAEGQYKEAVLLIQKSSFDESNLDELNGLMNIISTPELLTQLGCNDIYERYLYKKSLQSEFYDGNVTAIFPATPAHIKKYSRQNSVLIEESKELYAKVTKPFIDSQSKEKITWVYNIINGISEVDKIIWQNEHFILLPDSAIFSPKF